jgi:uncharacterized delta-60 repeat protein
LDTSFDPGTGANQTIYGLGIQSDGKIVVGGQFTTYNSVSRNYVARINTDGSLDTSFDPGTEVARYAYGLSIQPNDDKILVSGSFTSYGGDSNILRLNTDGSLDETFTATTNLSSNYSKKFLIQPDNKILAAGYLLSVTRNDYSIRGIIRLNPDGSDDTTFNAITDEQFGWMDDNGQAYSGSKSLYSSGSIAARDLSLTKEYDFPNDGRVSFYWKSEITDYSSPVAFCAETSPGVSCDAWENGYYDARIIGSTDWEYVSVPVSAGTNYLEWYYDGDASDGGVWIDDVRFYSLLEEKAITRTYSQVYFQDFESETFLPTDWTTGGDLNWIEDETTTYDSSQSSAGSDGSLDDDQTSWIETSYDFPADGTLEFYWKVSSEEDYDFLAFCQDNPSCSLSNADQSISGEIDWTSLSIPVTAGEHTFRWLFQKDGSASDGDNRGWIDNVSFEVDTTEEEDNMGIELYTREDKEVQITAYNTDDETHTPYSGDKDIIFSTLSTTEETPTAKNKEGEEVLFGSPTTLTFENGIATTDIKFYTPETTFIHVADGSFDSTDYGLNVNVTEGSLPPAGDDDPPVEDDPEDDSTPTSTEEEEEDDQYLELDDTEDDTLIFNVKIDRDNKIKSDTIEDDEDESTEIRNISIETKKDKKIKGKLEVESHQELPSELTFPEEVENCLPLQVNEIKADFSNDNVKEAKLTYRIPKGWLDKVENGKLFFSMNSKVKEKNKWARLLTSKLISIKKDDYIYQTSSDDLEGWWGVHVCGETTEEPPAEENQTPLPTIIEIDLDQDTNNEQALDTNRNPEDGYENFLDPDGSSTPIISEDLDNDGKTDHLIDTNADNLPDLYWDPDDQLITETPSLDIDNDQQLEQLIDINGDHQYDYYYDPEENSIESIDTLHTEDVDNDNQNEHLITLPNQNDPSQEEFFDPDGSSDVIAETDSGYLIDTDQDQQPDVYWNPNQDSMTTTQPLDIDEDGTLELIFGVTKTDHQEQGFYYDPDDQQIKSFRSEIQTPENFLTTISQATQRLITENPTATNTLVTSGLAVSLLPLLTQLNSTRDFWLIFKEILTRIFGILGWRRRKQKDWGIVYDVNTGNPLPFTEVQVIDKASGKVQEAKITDKYGAYYFLVNPGTYFLKYFKKGYQTITTPKENLKTFYGNSYLGGEIQKENLAKIYYDLPLAKKQESLTQKIIQQKTFSGLIAMVFWLGLIINLLAVWFSPSLINGLILTAYLFLVFVRHFMVKNKEWGLVLNSNHKPLPFTILKLIDTTTNQMYARTISDENGRYMLIGKPGKYSLEGSTNGRPLNLKPSSLSLNQRQAIKEELRGEDNNW